MRKNIIKYSKKLHLWIALITGVVSFIVCVTGALYSFKDEITNATEPWRFVTEQSKSLLLPSEILQVANNEVTDIKPSAITFGRSYESVFVDYFDLKTGMTTVFINPYDGSVLKVKNKKRNDFDFFTFVLKGHRSLWLPAPYGSLIVGWSIVAFVLILITGLILWIPRKLKNLKRNFKIRRKKINFDLHNTLGGIFLPFLLLLSITGLVWSFSWFSESLYFLTGGKDLKPYVLPKSEQMTLPTEQDLILDKLYFQLIKSNPKAPTFYIALPSDSSGCIRVSVEHKKNSYYRTDNLFFDQYTLAPLQGQGPYAGKYTEVSTPDKIRRMNLELHDGRIAGLTGKIIAVFTCIVGASLFITGLILFIKRKSKKRK